MRPLPTGTVTMLFTDIEGSTLLLNRLGGRFLEVLEIHRRVLREAWEAHGGTEMGTEGDSFFVVFTTAQAALRAAVQGQRQPAAHAWPDGERLKVRMSMHTGTPNVHDGDYWGMDVHRAARVAAAAHGGQVVLSRTTADLVHQDLPDGVEPADLGPHHLKDLLAPEHIYQLDTAGLETRFAPLRTVGSTSNLPHPVPALLGRDREVDEVAALVHTPGARVVTLTGPGGARKTRLAIAAAEQLEPDFPGGVFFASLTAVTSADVMWTSVAEAVDAPARERTPETFLRWLGDRQRLLVLDNLEQVVGAEEVVDRIVDLVRELLETVMTLRSPSVTMASASTVMNLLLRQARLVDAARRFGAEEAMHDRFAMPTPFRDEELAEAHELVAATMSPEEFDRHRLLGREEQVEDLLLELLCDASREPVAAGSTRTTTS